MAILFIVGYLILSSIGLFSYDIIKSIVSCSQDNRENEDIGGAHTPARQPQRPQEQAVSIPVPVVVGILINEE
jgi:hypothetical protein